MANAIEVPDRLYEHLKCLASRRETSSYKQVAGDCELEGMDLRFTKLAKMLTAVNVRELNRETPLLAAVVVNKKTGIQGPGFFDFPRAKVLIKGDEVTYWKEELERVFEYWARHHCD
jgi:hypothetical protein